MFRFRYPTSDDAEITLRWRTDPEVTRWMFTDIQDPSVERQRDWIARMADRPDFRHFIIEHEDRPIGYLSYSEIDRLHRRCASGSYLGTPEDRRRFGGYLHPFIMDYCFYGLGMHKLVNVFMAGNAGIIRIQKILKAREVGIHRDHVWKDGRFHDVHVYETLESEWRTHPHLFPREVTMAAFPPGEQDG